MRRSVTQQAVSLAVLTLLSLLVPVFALADEPGQKPQPLTIVEIIVKGNKALSAQAIIAHSGHRVGEPCTPQTLLDMRQRLMTTGNFGMHHPDQPERWVEITNEEKPSGSGKCTLTITVDENDKLTRVQITGSGPIKPEEVEKMIRLGVVYNETDILRSTRDIQELYNRRGYLVGFESDCFREPEFLDVFHIQLIVTRVAEIAIDVPEREKLRILKSLKTRAGDYFNSHLWKKDMARLQSQRQYRKLRVSEEIVGQGKIKLILRMEKSDSTNPANDSTKTELP